MQKIKEFIELFISNEYEFNYNEYNTEVSNIECDKLAEAVNALFYYPEYKRVSGIEERRGDAQWEQRYKLRIEKTTPRSLFQIKHYQNPTLGDALKCIVTGNDLYACYVSYDSTGGGRELYFSSIFYVAETDQGLKIIYRKGFDSDKGVWYHPVDMDVTIVIDEGQLVAVEKYQAPEEATSLADYNKGN